MAFLVDCLLLFHHGNRICQVTANDAHFVRDVSAKVEIDTSILLPLRSHLS